jgi:diaminohydroxyphosphoribosylaminopyrimidine deaminase / 5-amino-6-(5-phosphoribosylamino)uracil reductase
MAIRKNKFNSFNSKFLDLAFEQAKVNLGSTKTNPSVGCIIEKDGSVIASGRTSLNGRPHAERNALNKKIDFKNSNLYTTLEPCSHYGKTPPCTNIIIKKKVKNVYFSFFDEDKRSKKIAIKKLKIKKIKGKLIKSKKNKAFYNSYFSYKKNKLPFLEGKIAISNDYFTISKKNKWITNSFSRKRVHLLRSQYNAIITTSKTLNIDNSLLNCRIEGLEIKSPDIIIIDRNLKIKKNIKLYNIKKRKIYLITNSRNASKESFLKKKGIKIIRKKHIKSIDNFKDLLIHLNKLGFSRILVETGLKFMNFLILSKLINNVYIFKSKNNLKKNGLNNSTNRFIKKIKLINKINVNLNGDFLFKESVI